MLNKISHTTSREVENWMDQVSHNCSYNAEIELKRSALLLATQFPIDLQRLAIGDHALTEQYNARYGQGKNSLVLNLVMMFARDVRGPMMPYFSSRMTASLYFSGNDRSPTIEIQLFTKKTILAKLVAVFDSTGIISI